MPIAGDPLGERAIDAVRDLRADVIPRAFAGTDAEVLVTGDTAEELDYHETVDAWLLRVFAFVLGLSFVLLTIAFRSIVVPLKAIVAQPAVGRRRLRPARARLPGGRRQRAPRARRRPRTSRPGCRSSCSRCCSGSRWTTRCSCSAGSASATCETGDNDEAVAYGVGSTARLITGAALIIIAVFWGFAMGDLIMFQQMGFGVAVALLIDATIVRAVLVPAAMKLLGERNWYLPAGWRGCPTRTSRVPAA